jgi:hypothetical protein
MAGGSIALFIDRYMHAKIGPNMGGRPLNVHRLLLVSCFILIVVILSQNLTRLRRIHDFPGVSTTAIIHDDPSFFQSPQQPKKRRRKRVIQQSEVLPPRIDPAWLRRQSTNSSKDQCQVFPGDGDEGGRGYQALNKIRYTLKLSNAKHLQSPTSSITTAPLRVLCLVFTNSNRDTMLAGVLDTYAPRCDGVVVLSNITDLSKKSISIASAEDGPIDNDIEWSRLRRGLLYVNEYYHDDYDFFHFAPDDTYVVVDNLRDYLTWLVTRLKKKAGKNYDNIPFYLGALMPMNHDPTRRYCDGRAGFTINRATLTRIVTKLSSRSSCANATLPIDQRIADCLYEEKIVCTDTSDRDRGARYHPFSISVRSNLFPENKNISFPWNELSKHHKAPARGGNNGISVETISFRSNHHRRSHAILYGSCDSVWEKHSTALDEHGRPGYVHNATFLRSHPVPFAYNHGDCDVPFGNGTEGHSGYLGLKKIKIATTGDKKVLCMVYTHSNRHHRVQSIAETYGARCDGFFAASNVTNRTIGAVHLLHEGPEAYANMWLKIRAMWEYAYDHYLHEFDFFMIGGDDYYVIAENLKYFVSTGSWKGPWNHSEPLFLGGSLINMPYTRRRYCGGGAGYTLNRVALRLLIEQLWRLPACWPHHRASDEDRIISSCFDAAGIRCMDTNDIRNETT